MIQVKTKIKVALGNGTRDRGEDLFAVDLDDGAELHQLMEAAWNVKDVSDLPCKVELAEGVESAEVLTALRNPGVCEIVDDSHSAESGAPPDDWRDVKVASLKVDRKVVDALSAVGLTTVGQVFDFANENEGLTSIDGIGEKSAAAIRDEIRRVLPDEFK